MMNSTLVSVVPLAIFVYLRANVVVVGDIVQLKKVFLSQDIKLFPLAFEV